MHVLRTSSLLARLVLLWFACVLGVAAASPIVHPQAMELACSASGNLKLVVMGDDGQAMEAGQHSLDCALCLAAHVPPPRTHTPPVLPQPLAHALLPTVAAHIAALVGAPLPPRGPPFFS
ncbi:DUF2946 family protein [Xylophilus sp. GW821-FHT01B05]